MTIVKYNTTFTEKSQFATDYYPTEEKLICHYVEGLPFEYRAVVRLNTTLVEAMDEARKIENDIAIQDRTTASVTLFMEVHVVAVPRVASDVVRWGTVMKIVRVLNLCATTVAKWDISVCNVPTARSRWELVRRKMKRQR
ncbi:unnamed protein product [Lactuca saligna]|uniref:Uncharacterized protein n=1 Tax=Lactuca saligna TaxID=75948 RepID=A0AA35YYI9_LACSI|nr:unnamed protein product [Lactuca saligna]